MRRKSQRKAPGRLRAVEKSECAAPPSRKRPIDWDLVAEWFRAQALVTEVASALGLDRVTLYRRCEAETGLDIPAFRAANTDRGKVEVRMAQLKFATECVAGAIWFGKQHLEQSDRPQGRDALPVEVDFEPLSDDECKLIESKDSASSDKTTATG